MTRYLMAVYKHLCPSQIAIDLHPPTPPGQKRIEIEFEIRTARRKMIPLKIPGGDN